MPSTRRYTDMICSFEAMIPLSFLFFVSRALEAKRRNERGIIASKIQITSVYSLVEGIAKDCVGGELSVDKMGCSVDFNRWLETYIEFILIPHNEKKDPSNPEVEVLPSSADGTR
jgi:hypothetical protein